MNLYKGCTSLGLKFSCPVIIPSAEAFLWILGIKDVRSAFHTFLDCSIAVVF